MSYLKWEIGPVKLANGCDAFIDAINEGQEKWRYIGRTAVGSTWMPAGWHDNGRMMYVFRDSGNHLAPRPKKKVRVNRWLNVDADDTVSLYKLRSEADTHCFSDRIACIEIDIEITDGEGL